MGKLIEKLAEGAGSGAIGAALGLALGGYNDRRQVRQQRKLRNVQIEGMEHMSEFEKQQQLDLWNQTNYGAQKEHMKAAGLNPGLMYGMSGGGGATTGSGSGGSVTGGNADGAAAGIGAQTQMAMMLAQKGLMEAQTEKTKAEAENISGVDKELKTENVTSAKWLNEVNKFVGVQLTGIGKMRELETKGHEEDIKGTEALKKDLEYNAWRRSAGLDTGRDIDEILKNPNNPLRKQAEAEMQTAVQALKNAKATQNLTEAETVLKTFEGELTKMGITPGSPWYVKFITDMAKEAGLNPTKYAENMKGAMN